MISTAALCSPEAQTPARGEPSMTPVDDPSTGGTGAGIAAVSSTTWPGGQWGPRDNLADGSVQNLTDTRKRTPPKKLEYRK